MVVTDQEHTIHGKLLVADDSPKNLNVILNFFSADHVEILYASNGQLAIDIAKKELPDLIIMDWDMPVKSGIEATREISQDPLTREIPVIIATGVMTSPENLQTALESGAVDFVRKPYNHIELLARVNSALRLTRAHKEIKHLLEKEKDFLQQQVDLKERELSSFVMKAHERNRVFDSLVETIDKLDSHTSESGKILIKELKRNIKAQMSNENNWEHFVLQFEKVHPDFLNQLKSKHESLTINDLKLCAYIRIGLNNKEIANTSGIAYFSVKKNINRLKKKLGLNQQDDIRNFLLLG